MQHPGVPAGHVQRRRGSEGRRRSSRSTPPPAPTSTGSSTPSSRAGSPPDELIERKVCPCGTVESAGFLRSGGGIPWNFAYLYSPDKRPPQWESPLDPVMITPIADTGWWFEKSPND